MIRRVLVLLALSLTAVSAQQVQPKKVRSSVEGEIKALVRDSRNFHRTRAEMRPLLERHAAELAVAGAVHPWQRLDGLSAKVGRWEWYWQDRVLPDGSYPDLHATYVELMEQRAAGLAGTTSVPAVSWTNINQTTAASGYNGMGRATDIAFHPSDPDIFWVSSPRGGIWKTTDGGLTYAPISDSLPFVSVSNVAVDPSNPDTLYAAIGDHVWYGPPSSGVYKTTDGGATWQPTGLSFAFSSGIRIYDLVVHPVFTSTVFVATSNGLYRSADGLTNHSRVFTLDTRDFALRPGDNLTAYLTARAGVNSEVWKSSDVGQTWTMKSNITSTTMTLRLAVTPANPSIVDVLTENGMFHRSTDSGETWSAGVPLGEGGEIVTSATNANRVYGGFLNIYRSTNGGSSFTQQTAWFDNHPTLVTVHADQRNVEVNPLRPDSIYWCNDGGLYEYIQTSDTFVDRSDGLIITQYYKVASSQTDPMVLTGGSQDNGGRLRRADGSWAATNGGDAMEVAIDPTDPDVLYTEYVGGQLYRTNDGWQTDTYYNIRNNIGETVNGDWVTPFMLDPNDSDTIVAGYEKVFRSIDRGETWTAISGEIAGGNPLDELVVAPSDSGVIYASESGYTGDAYGTGGGSIFRTVNLGAQWTTATALPTANRIKGLEVSDVDPDVVYATTAGYSAGEKVYVSTDGGGTWLNASGTLPNVPANDVRFVPGSSHSVYVATDVGVYYRDDSLEDWVVFGADLPMISVVDIDFQESADLVRIATHGRGVYEAPRHALPRSPYCEPRHAGCCDDHIASVTLGNLSHASGTGASLVTAGYSNFTPFRADLGLGETATLTVTPSASHADSRLGVWIDWNHDDVFDAGERVLSLSGPGPFSGPVTVPGTATGGETVMRIRLQRGAAYDPAPCQSSGSPNGETEDYTIFVQDDGDGDLVPDHLDSDPQDPNVCRDLDADGCDDCTSGADDPASDGPDADADGLCDAGDPDADDDGVANAADCAPLTAGVATVPGAVAPRLTLARAGSVAELTWWRAANAPVSNVYAGTITGPGFVYDEACLAGEVAGEAFADAAVPPAGGAIYYLVSARNVCGEGPSGADSLGTSRFTAPPCPALGADQDGDGIPDVADGCPTIADPGQADLDGDFVGDACDRCPAVHDPEDPDTDLDGSGDGCDPCTDRDGDGFGEPGVPGQSCPTDNCPAIANPAQADLDADGAGDACDSCPDPDGDGACDPFDGCPGVADPGQEDADGDGIGDACDLCPTAFDPTGDDADGDGLGDACDPCFAQPDLACVACPPGSDPDGDGVCSLTEPVVEPGAATRYVASPTDPGVGTLWRDPAFDDAGWSLGSFGIGYDSAGANPLLATQTSSGLPSVYTRTTFEVADAASWSGLVLGADYDDGYAVWLNGVELYRSPELPGAGPLAWDTSAAPHESGNGAGGGPIYGTLVELGPSAAAALQTGTNVLAIGVWNTNVSSSDLVLVPWVALAAVDNCPATPNPDQADTDQDGTGDACE